MPVVEYEPGKAFPGVIGRTVDESSPAWPAPVRPKDGTPNAGFIVLDDPGFGNLGCYGSPIATPNLDAIAASGVRYNNTHTHGAVLAEPLVHPDRAQPPLERHGCRSRVRVGLPRWYPDLVVRQPPGGPAEDPGGGDDIVRRGVGESRSL